MNKEKFICPNCGHKKFVLIKGGLKRCKRCDKINKIPDNANNRINKIPDNSIIVGSETLKILKQHPDFKPV